MESFSWGYGSIELALWFLNVAIGGSIDIYGAHGESSEATDGGTRVSATQPRGGGSYQIRL